MKIHKFKFIETTDINDKDKYPNWSRAYEYPIVLNAIENHNKIEKPEIHNSSWGFEGVHVTFRDELDTIGECIHSDIVKSKFRDTFHYDITEEKDEFNEKFDFVLNVSTIEHLPTKDLQLKAIENLFKQVKKGGRLIVTFDYPRVDLPLIENWVKEKCESGANKLNGENSIIPNTRYKNLNIVFLVLEK